MERQKEREFQINEDEVAQYFPFDKVVAAIMDVYQHLLQLHFEKLETDNKWHEDVLLYRVSDSITDEFVGHFYLDMFPRCFSSSSR